MLSGKFLPPKPSLSLGSKVVNFFCLLSLAPQSTLFSDAASTPNMFERHPATFIPGVLDFG